MLAKGLAFALECLKQNYDQLQISVAARVPVPPRKMSLKTHEKISRVNWNFSPNVASLGMGDKAIKQGNKVGRQDRDEKPNSIRS